MKSLVFIHSWYIDYFLNYFSLLKYLWRRQWHPTPVLLPGKSRGQRSLVGCSPWGPEEWDTTEWRHFHFSLSCIGEGNGNPLQCSCLENSRDGGAWWTAIYGVAQSRTWMKRLSSSSSSTQVFFVTWLFSLYFYYEAMYYCCLSMDEWSHCGCSDILIPASGIPEQLQWVCSSISFVCTMISLKL